MSDYKALWDSLNDTLSAESKSLKGEGPVADVLEAILSHMRLQEKIQIIDAKYAARRKEVPQ